MSNLPFEKKKRRVRRNFLLWSGVFLVLGAALVGILYFILYSDFFTVREFEVADTRYTLKNELLAALDSEMIARSRILSMLGTDNILFWEFGRKPEKIDSLPLVAKISVEADLTARKVRIEAEERRFSGVWCLVSEGVTGDCYAFDNKGILFARAPETEGSLILKVFSENSRPVVLGMPIFPKPEWRENFFRILESFENYNLPVSRVGVRDFQIEEWEVQTGLPAQAGEGPRFLFSLNSSPQNLAGILEKLRDKFEFDKVDYFDFRVENRIYYE